MMFYPTESIEIIQVSSIAGHHFFYATRQETLNVFSKNYDRCSKHLSDSSVC